MPRKASQYLPKSSEQKRYAAAYHRYLESPDWAWKRWGILQDRNHTCERCGHWNRAGQGMVVHHLTYDRIGHELPGDLQLLCADCHRNTHGIRGGGRFSEVLIRKEAAEMGPEGA